MSTFGNEDHSISLQDAAEMTEAYRDANPGASKGIYYSGSALTSIINQTNCVGVRFYYGLKSDGSKTLVLTGVDANGNDLYTGELAQNGLQDPPYSSVSNPLNS